MIFFLLFLFIGSISIVGFSLYVGISPMPSSRAAKEAILSLIPPDYKNIYELGAGWGTLALPIAHSHPSSRIHAIEISPIPWMVLVLRRKIQGFSNVMIKRKNFFSISLHEADLIVCYLYPGAMKKLKAKFENELKAGTLVITNSFAIPGWIPLKEIQTQDFWNSRIYLYEKRAHF